MYEVHCASPEYHPYVRFVGDRGTKTRVASGAGDEFGWDGDSTGGRRPATCHKDVQVDYDFLVVNGHSSSTRCKPVWRDGVRVVPGSDKECDARRITGRTAAARRATPVLGCYRLPDRVRQSYRPRSQISYVRARGDLPEHKVVHAGGPGHCLSRGRRLGLNNRRCTSGRRGRHHRCSLQRFTHRYEETRRNEHGRYHYCCGDDGIATRRLSVQSEGPRVQKG
jgi:hypothetical protein